MRFTRIGALSASNIAVVMTVMASIGCGPQQAAQVSQAPASSTADLMKQRGLTEADVSAALQTYTPTGKKDTYLTFASGGHGGNMIVIGVPSMRILKYVGVFTPEPWQGYGYGDQSGQVLAMGSRFGKEMTWGDMHHPALSETAGDYDGKFVFVNDKANARIAVVDLHDFVTKQIVTSQLIQSDHGATFVTPNTEYVIESSQYPAPLGGGYAPIEDYQEKYRGAVIFWKFDREKGKIDPSNSFAMELPPYMQDLADAGKLASEGWVFINSFNTEMSYGGTLEGRPPMESGASQNDMDYMHIINLKAAEAVYKAGKTTKIAGMDVITLETSNEEGLLHLLGEPKSPHGMDVTPDGKELVVSGKLDTHGTVYEFAKIKALIDAKKYAGKDQYGVPILPFEDSIRGQVEIGLGPLHTQFDDKGNAYTSVFIESTVAKWSLKDLKLIEKIKVHYNVGHIVAAEGDTVSPDGGYLIAMDKWALDRFNKVGPLLPQNFQLININSEPMQLIYDMPLPLGEPHYAQMIKADKINPVDVYKPAGYDVVTDAPSPNAVKAKEERIEREGKNVHVYMTSVRSHFTPDIIRVKKGDTVHLHITNVEQAHDATHGFTIGSYNVHSSLEPGKHVDITFVADREGTFPFYCTEFCSALHLEMAGYLLVEPS
ncbi:MAG: Sec-dependent nitrous-oxide reductase [Deltaproteobacteria bacterium]|nr:Sec-dependent nitrous-oxide reductase [Deltaproteobacteria bacterium]MBW2628563.1 Sec-dependent nitrous-oxide reductase [Deltaproteobacteria bacterium]